MSLAARRLLVAAAIVALAVFLVEALLFALHPREAGDAAQMSAPAAPVAVEPASAPVAAALPGEARSVAVEPPRVEPSEDAPELPAATVWLVGAVRSKTTPMYQVKLFALPQGPTRDRSSGLGRAVSGTPQADGAFRIDVSRAFLVGAPFPEVLLVQVTREAGSSVELEVPVSFERSSLERAVELELTAEIVLPEECRVDGKAWLMDDLTASVQVAAFELTDGLPSANAVAVGVADAREHVFQLPLSCAREYFVVAFREGYRPRGQRVRTDDLYPVDALALEPGELVSGRASFRDAPLRGRVVARPANASSLKGCTTGGARFVWTGEELEWAEIVASTGPDGAFEVRGLAPGVAEVVLAQVTGVAARRPASAAVVAPASGVALTPELAELRLEMLSEGAPLANSVVLVIERTHDGKSAPLPCRTDAAGVGVLWLEPGATVEIRLDPSVTARAGPAGSSTTLRVGQ